MKIVCIKNCAAQFIFRAQQLCATKNSSITCLWHAAACLGSGSGDGGGHSHAAPMSWPSCMRARAPLTGVSHADKNLAASQQQNCSQHVDTRRALASDATHVAILPAGAARRAFASRSLVDAQRNRIGGGDGGGDGGGGDGDGDGGGDSGESSRARARVCRRLQTAMPEGEARASATCSTKTTTRSRRRARDDDQRAHFAHVQRRFFRDCRSFARRHRGAWKKAIVAESGNCKQENTHKPKNLASSGGTLKIVV